MCKSGLHLRKCRLPPRSTAPLCMLHALFIARRGGATCFCVLPMRRSICSFCPGFTMFLDIWPAICFMPFGGRCEVHVYAKRAVGARCRHALSRPVRSSGKYPAPHWAFALLRACFIFCACLFLRTFFSNLACCFARFALAFRRCRQALPLFSAKSFVIPAIGPVSGRALVNGFFNCKTACIKYGLTISRQKSETVILLIPHKMSALIFRCFSRTTSGGAGCPTASAESISYPAGSASFANVSLFACIAKLFQQNRMLYHSQVRGLRVTRRNRRVLRRFNHFCKILFRNFLIRMAAHGSTQMQHLFKFYVDDAPGLFCLCAIGVITQASPILPQWRSPGIAKTPEKREFGKQSDLISWRTVALFLQL